jgi:hypothetical protein
VGKAKHYCVEKTGIFDEGRDKVGGLVRKADEEFQGGNGRYRVHDEPFEENEVES